MMRLRVFMPTDMNRKRKDRAIISFIFGLSIFLCSCYLASEKEEIFVYLRGIFK